MGLIGGGPDPITDGISSAWDWGKGAVSNVLQGAGLSKQPASLDVKGASQPIVQKADTAFNSAMAGASAAGVGPQIQAVTPQQIGVLPGVGAGSIQNMPEVQSTHVGGLPQVAVNQIVDPGSNVTGAGAASLRQDRLNAATSALNAPSAAAAVLAGAQGKIGRQALGAAAAARGADRASARRSAVLGIGASGIQAASDAAALAAQEQATKAQAFSQALGAIQQGDVAAGGLSTTAQTANLNADLASQGQNLSAALERAKADQATDLAAGTANLGAWTNIVKANQEKDLAATKTTAELELARQRANMEAGITAGTANNAAAINAYGARENAQNAYLGTALQAGGLQNTNLGVQANYLGNYDAIRQKQNAAAAGTVGAGLGALSTMTGGSLSDERAKTDIEPLSSKSPSLADSYGGMLADVYGVGDMGSPWAKPTTAKGQDFLQMPEFDHPATEDEKKGGGGLLGNLGGLGAATGLGALAFSDERTKTGKGKAGDMAAWSDDVDPISFRYKPGFEDNGKRPHIGVGAHQLRSTGPIGESLVREDPSGYLKVDYPELAFAMAVGAKERADEAWDMAKKKKEAR